MPQDQLLLTTLVILVFANILLIAWIRVRTVHERPSPRADRVQTRLPTERDELLVRPSERSPSGPRASTPERPDLREMDDIRAAAAIETFVARIPADAAGLIELPARPEAGAATGAIVGGAAPGRSAADPLTDARSIVNRGRSSTVESLHLRDTPDSTPTGATHRVAWDRILREESVRRDRSGRPVTVVMAELPHLDNVGERLGPAVAAHIVTETARVLATEGRAEDQIAWLGGTEFGVLLRETGEIAARSYVDRVRAAADGWLESAGLSIRLSFGWASPEEGTDVIAAANTAEERMRDVARGLSPGPSAIVGA